MTNIIDLLIRHRKKVLFSGIIITIFWGINLINLSIDGSFSSVLPETDPDFLFNRSVEEDFGSSDEVIILIKNQEGIYTKDVIELIQGFSEGLALIKDIEESKVISLLTLSGFETPGAGNSSWNEALTELSIFMKTDPLAAGTLVNSEGTTTVIMAPVSGELALSENRLRSLVNQVENLTLKYQLEYPGTEILLSGHPIVNAEIMDKMANDLYLLFPIAVLATALMLLYILRSFRGMLIPLLITLMSVIWTFGLKGLLRSPLTITETVIPVILISISCADGIHIVSEAFHFMHHGMSARKAIIRTIGDLWKPVVLTSLTTALGFASFAFSSGQSLRNMGLFLSFGVMSAMLFSLFFIPVLFSWYKPSKKHEERTHYNRQYRLLKKIEKATVFFIRWRIPVIIASILVLGISVGGMLNINTDTDEIRYFKADNPVRQTAEMIEKEMGGLSILQIVLEGEEGTFRDLSMLKSMAVLQRKLETRAEVSQSVSLSDTVSYLFYTMRDRNPDYFIIPDNQNFLNRLITIITTGDDNRSSMLSSYVTEDFSRARIMVRINDSNTRVMETLLRDIDGDLDLFRNQGLEVGFAGDYLRLSNGRVIVKSQLMSLSMTLGIILLVLSLIYRSFLSGLIVALPVMIAVLFNFSVMWVFKVSLNPATAIIAAVGLGVGIDYSIHIFSRLQLLRRKGGSFQSSLVNAVAESARGILSNALSVGIGFLILLLSAYRIINDMGWIIALTMLTTSLASLILLPCLLSLRQRKETSAQ
ncbi:MAG: RND family transporter [Spirochaetales bacterium]|nr:RND family transporter [Spirochaetales bacterium]